MVVIAPTRGYPLTNEACYHGAAPSVRMPVAVGMVIRGCCYHGNHSHGSSCRAMQRTETQRMTKTKNASIAKMIVTVIIVM